MAYVTFKLFVNVVTKIIPWVSLKNLEMMSGVTKFYMREKADLKIPLTIGPWIP